MKGYKTYRHKDNPKEKEFHDKFIDDNKDQLFSGFDYIAFGQSDVGMKANDTLTERETRIMISTIQWLGSPVGQSFLRDCGFEQINQ